MKQIFTKLIKSVLVLFSVALMQVSSAQACSDAGTASATVDSICPNGITTLTLANYIGAIQWQSFNGSAWVNEVGVGSTTDNYAVTPSSTKDYRAVVTAVGCSPDTSSIVTITVGVSAPTTQGASRCGYGPVTLNAVGNGIFKWYDSLTSLTPISTGQSLTTNVGSTTTFYCAAATSTGGASTTPMPAQASTFSGNARGYFFTAPTDFTITGLFVPGNNGTLQNIAVIRFDNNIPPPAYATTTNAFATLFVTQNDPSTGVIPVSIPILAGEVIGVLATRGPGDINSYAPSPATTTINGTAVTLTRMGMQLPLASNLPQTIWQEAGGSISRLEITYETGCESPRTPTVATVIPAPTATISANPPALCSGQSTTLSAVSNNANYTYTWSPSSSLSASTGSSVTATPSVPTVYTLVSNDGLCGYIDSLLVDVGPASVAGTAVISTDTICLGSNATLFLTGNTGNIQWQRNTGSGWVNETGTGYNSGQYLVSPTSNIQYRAIVTSGGCAPVITSVLDLTVLAVTDPLTVNDTICGGGVVNLSASGVGVLDWYTAPTGGNSINVGNTYSPTIGTTTTYYVEASAGGTYNVGPASGAIGTQFPVVGSNWGLTFDVTQTVTLDRVYISPGGTSGPITINMRSAIGGAILNTKTVNVIAFSGLQPITIGWTINPGVGYTLELDATSVPLYYNSFGAAYPYTFPGSSVSITGFYNPTPGTTNFYYFFYNWQITEGCKSNRVPVTGVINPTPPVPIINTLGTVLSSTSPTGNQWYLNGNPITGATGISHDMALTGSGLYTVVVTASNGCTTSSLPYLYSSVGENFASAAVSVYPNPASEMLHVEFANQVPAAELIIYNQLGSEVARYELAQIKNKINLNFAPGSYMMELRTPSGVYFDKLIKM
ncbi:MAG: T9SS type A sorting domain-containing protein [Bacteroidota bacterium]